MSNASWMFVISFQGRPVVISAEDVVIKALPTTPINVLSIHSQYFS